MTQILLFTKTTGYRHEEAITEGIAMIRAAAAHDAVEVVASEDASVFTHDGLASFNAVVWFQVSGNVLSEDQRAAFDDYLRGGGGFAGIHGASDAERSWPAYADIVGARFLYHPELQEQTADLLVAKTRHASTVGLPPRWSWTDEWYVFDRNPRDFVDVLLTVDEGTYNVQEKSMGVDHPISWAGTFGNGRTWYTALGHHPDSYADREFANHIWGGITSVLGH